MARAVVLTLDGETSTFGLSKVDRTKLYGSRRRLPLDAAGNPCQRASLTRDGRFLIQAGMTAQGYFDDNGRMVERSEMIGLSPTGEEVPEHPSTLGVAQELEPVRPQELLDLRLQALYALEAEEVGEALKKRLEAGEVFHFPFNYRTDFNLSDAFLVANEQGVFALVGSVAEPVWVESVAAPVALDDGEDDFDDDLDFEMF